MAAPDQTTEPRPPCDPGYCVRDAEGKGVCPAGYCEEEVAEDE